MSDRNDSNVRSTPSDRLNTSFHVRLVELASEAAGFSASEVTGFAPETVRKAAEALVKAGRLVRSKVSPRRVRYFASDKLAGAYQSKPARRAGPVAGGSTRFKAAWAEDEPAIITSKTKITVAPPLPRDVYRTLTYPQF